MKYILTYEAFEQPKEKEKLDKKKESEKEKEKKKKEKEKEKACKHPEQFRIKNPFGERCQLCGHKIKDGKII